jgi:ubiquinone/menaquinone biosynthesis C-methylase UbiE
MENYFAQLAEVAELHASERLGVLLPKSTSIVDARLAGLAIDTAVKALRRMLADGSISSDELETAIGCYGAWIGSWLVHHRQGEWVGLQEPVAPRVLVARRLVCPHESIRESLQSQASSMTFGERLEIVEAWMQAENASNAWQSTNAVAWNQLSTDPHFVSAQQQLSLEEAESRLDPWLRQDGGVHGKRVLCLAAGGGTHGPLFAMAGADVIVADLSESMLRFDLMAAKQHGLKLECIQGDMSNMAFAEEESIDIVIQPVSTSYVRELRPLFQNVARVLKPNGLYLSQHKSPGILRGDSCVDGSVIHDASTETTNVEDSFTSHPHYREPGSIEFHHSVEALIGGMCRAGLSILDIQEPPRGNAWAPKASAEYMASKIAPYLKVMARKKQA